MHKILTLNAIADVGVKKFTPSKFEVSDKMENPDGIILRSFEMNGMELPSSLLAVARAGAGTNNIPIEKCSENGIVVFNTPGANANAVKEMVITGIFIGSRRVVDGIQWAKSLKGQPNVEKLVEKGKGQFSGPEIKGKKLGVIGLGAIGVLVANAAVSLGMEVYGFDPYLSVDAAWSLSSSVIRADSMEAVAAQCDYITIHVPLNGQTRGMYNEELFAATNKGARLLNFARGEIVDFEALKKALDEGIISQYITDFPTAEILELENAILIPHLGASTPESEENCAEMAAMELKGYLEYGVIKNSVNFPACEAHYTGKVRITIAHKNIPSMVGFITGVLSKAEVNIDNMTNKSKGTWAYTLIDIDDFNGKKDQIMAELAAINGVVKARIVREK